MIALAGLTIGGLGVVGWVVDVANSAPDITQLKPRDPGQLSEVFASDGTALGYIHSDILRTEVTENQLPLILRRATVAIEDRRFWQHGGIDLQGILRAAVKDAFGGGGSLQGGSTLTMQLVRNVYLPYQLADTRSLKRKIIEAKLAEELESKHEKSWILSQYLNDVAVWDASTDRPRSASPPPPGCSSTGRCGRSSLAQAALLAGLPQAPSAYNPFQNPALARQRRHEVLAAMVQSHYITAQQAARADRAHLEVKLNNTYTVKREPYVFDYVRQALIQRFGLATVEQGGLKVYTTIDLHKQQHARQAILANEGRPGDPAAALVNIDPSNGHILAMATSSTYNQTNFDYATQSHRQTGSAFKVFVLMTLIHDYHGDPNQTYYNSQRAAAGLAARLSDLPRADRRAQLSGQHQHDQGDDAVRQHRVRPARRRRRTRTKVAAMAHAMGITSHLDGIPAEGIGGLRIGVSPLEMADAYATLANGGDHIAPTAITKVVFPDGSVVNLGDPHEEARVQLRRGVRGRPGPEDRDPVRHRHRGQLRLPGRREDRHDEQLHRRLVRRLHASAGHGGVGRLPELDDLDE